MTPVTVNRIHQFSPDRLYRYTLWREFDLFNPSYLMVIGLNPSTADEENDDATLERCIAYAKSWGYGSLVMTNLFAFRETDPNKMKAHPEPIGPANDAWLKAMSVGADLVLAAWGKHGSHMDRAEQVMRLVGELHCLSINKDGSPHHPLYQRADVRPQPYHRVPV